MARVHRLAALFAAFGFVLPYAPQILGVPQQRSCIKMFFGGDECALLGIGFMTLALIFAGFGARSWPEEGYWKRVTNVGLAWIALGLVF